MSNHYTINLININNLQEYTNNARTHSDSQVSQIAESIKEFGFNNPVLVDENNQLIAGHGRLLAAKQLGLTEVPAITLSHLTETQKKAYVIADNKISLNSDWNYDLLTSELEAVMNDSDVDISLLGFSEQELETVLDEGQHGFNSGSIDGNTQAQADALLGSEDKLQILVDVMSNQECETLLNELNNRGFNCKVV